MLYGGIPSKNTSVSRDDNCAPGCKYTRSTFRAGNNTVNVVPSLTAADCTSCAKWMNVLPGPGYAAELKSTSCTGAPGTRDSLSAFTSLYAAGDGKYPYRIKCACNISRTPKKCSSLPSNKSINVRDSSPASMSAPSFTKSSITM